MSVGANTGIHVNGKKNWLTFQEVSLVYWSGIGGGGGGLLWDLCECQAEFDYIC